MEILCGRIKFCVKLPNVNAIIIFVYMRAFICMYVKYIACTILKCARDAHVQSAKFIMRDKKINIIRQTPKKHRYIPTYMLLIRRQRGAAH